MRLCPVRGALLGGLIAFAWSAVSWMALPFHNKTLHFFADPAPVVEAIAAHAPVSGVYLVANDPKGQKAPTDPFVFVSYNKSGWGPMGRSMLLGLLAQIAGGLFWTLILAAIPGLTPGSAARYGAAFGLAVGMLGALPNSIWWKFPWDFNAMYVVDDAVAWTLASAAIARFACRSCSTADLS